VYSALNVDGRLPYYSKRSFMTVHISSLSMCASQYVWVYGCPEYFRDSPTTPMATIPNIFHEVLFRSTL